MCLLTQSRPKTEEGGIGILGIVSILPFIISIIISSLLHTFFEYYTRKGIFSLNVSYLYPMGHILEIVKYIYTRKGIKYAIK